MWSDNPLQNKRMAKHDWYEPGKCWIVDKKGQVKLQIWDKINYHCEKAFYLSGCELLQSYCCDPFKLYKIKFENDYKRLIVNWLPFFSIKLGQNPCRNSILPIYHQLEANIFQLQSQITPHTGPILKSKGMHVIFQKIGYKRAKKGKVFENVGKNVQNLRIFWKRAGDRMWLLHSINC